MRNPIAGPALYGHDFYEGLVRYSRPSAERVVEALLSWVEPNSVLDVGCGPGVWLEAFAHAGIAELTGVDQAALPEDTVVCKKAEVLKRDLQAPFSLGRRFDLLVCLEVAEHLIPSAADALVGSLCSHGDLILFSAAVPGQGGHGHINEQWQSYWATKFARHGFLPFDVIRPALWSDPAVAFCYRQNTLLYARETSAAYTELQARGAGPPAIIDLVHPLLWGPPGIRQRLGELPGYARRAMERRMPLARAGHAQAYPTVWGPEHHDE